MFSIKRKGDYYTGRHSCYLLQYHLVLVTKYRHKVIIDDLKDYLIEYTKKYFKDKELNILEMNTDKDHVHIMFEAYPNLNLYNFVKAYKSASTKKVRNKFSKVLSKYYWKHYFWSQSYFICTVSERSLNMVRQYIKNQGLR